MEQKGNVWAEILKFTLSSSFKKNFYKMMYCGYMSLEKLAKMHKDISNLCWKCEQHKGTFYYM